jgi:hypothetical protein
MNIRQMAAARVAVFMAVSMAMGGAVSLAITYWGLAIVGIALSTAVLLYLIKMLYDIELDKLERNNSLAKLKDLG